MLEPGDDAPPFRLPGTAAGSIDRHELREYTTRGWSVVLVFYPFDFHPACTSQWCSLRDADWLTLLDSTVVLGIGGDAVYSHREYAAANSLEFALLSDADGSVAESYGVLAEVFEGHLAVPERAIFVVGPDETIRYAWQADTPSEQPDLSAVAEAAEHTEPPSVGDSG